MNSKMDFRGRWVLVTGASSGLGQAMAIQLARDHGAHLILVARREDRLRQLQDQLTRDYGVQCQVIAADLSCPEAVERVFSESTRQDVYAVVLNAGVTHFGLNADLSWPAFEQLLATNLTSVVRLVNLFVPWLIGRGQHGGILLVCSMAGLLPVPYQSAYAGTKAFVTHFGQSLYHELRDQPVSVTTFCPGGIQTEMTSNSKLDFFNNTALVQSAEACARDALQAFARRDYLRVPGLLNRLQVWGARVLPRKWIGAIAANAYRKALQQ